QAIRRLRREQPHTKIVVTGCAAQTDPELFVAMPEVDHVLGNEAKLSAASWAAFDSAGKISVGDIMAVKTTALHPRDRIAGHSRADAIAFCEQVRRLRPDVAFGGDIIAGFPTETEAMFGRSLDLVDECGLTQLHVFPFSPRPGTPAERMPQVAGDVVKERARR